MLLHVRLHGGYSEADLLSLGATCLVPKPFDLKELARSLRRAAETP